MNTIETIVFFIIIIIWHEIGHYIGIKLTEKKYNKKFNPRLETYKWGGLQINYDSKTDMTLNDKLKIHLLGVIFPIIFLPLIDTTTLTIIIIGLGAMDLITVIFIAIDKDKNTIIKERKDFNLEWIKAGF